MKSINDQTIPGLAIVNDSGAFEDALRRTIPRFHESFEIVERQLGDIRYVPGARCILFYKLKLRDRSTGRVGDRWLTAHALRQDEAHGGLTGAIVQNFGRWLRHYGDPLAQMISSPSAFDPKLRIVFYPFPADPALPTLTCACSPNEMARHLASIWKERGFRILQVELEPIVYTPHLRISLGYNVRVENRATGERTTIRLIGKMNARRPPALLHADAYALWHVARGRIGLAEPVGYLPLLPMTLQKKVGGERLTEFTTREDFVDKVRLTASAAAALHKLVVPLNRRRHHSVEIRFVQRQAKIARALRPDLASLIDGLSRDLTKDFEDNVVVNGPVHGDLHSANILVEGDRITLIDLESMSLGDTARDIGRFMTSLRSRSLRQYGDHNRLAPVREAFLAHYLCETGEDERRVRIFECAWLLHAANYLFQIQWPGWPDLMEALLREAQERHAALVRKFHPVSSAKPTETDLGFDERIRWATNSSYIQLLLTPHVERAYQGIPTGCHISPGDSRGKHLQIRYSLEGTRSDAPWRQTLVGHLWRYSTGRGRYRRYERLQESLTQNPAALQPARLIAYLPQLSEIIVEEPPGAKFTALLGTPEGIAAARVLAQSLAALHRMSLRVERVRATDKHFGQVNAEAKDLKGLPIPRARDVMQIVEEARRGCKNAEERRAPTLGGLPLDQIRYAKPDIALAGLYEIASSNPLFDAADFLAHLAVATQEANLLAWGDHCASQFRSVYLCASSTSRAELAPFEALALARAACIRMKLRHRDKTAVRVLDRALDCLRWTPRPGQLGGEC